jgi:MFS family permease
MANGNFPRPAGGDAWMRANLRWNMSMLSLDYGLFGLGLSLIATTTILPAFAQRLGASNIVIGFIPAILTVGWGLPSILFANYIERLERKLPLVLAVTVGERIPYLFLALAAYFLARTQPALVLALTILLVAIAAVAGGVIMGAWLDIVAKSIPVRLRGRFFALGSVISGVTGVGGGALAVYFLGVFPFPDSYALCFFVAFLAFAASFAFLYQTREPPEKTAKPAIPFGDYMRRLPEVLRRDRAFSSYLVAKALTIGGTMSNGFFTVYGLTKLAAGQEQVAIFTLFQQGSLVLSTVVWGQLADHRGNKIVLILGALCGAGASALALWARDVQVLYGVFVLMGLSLGAVNISHMNIMLEFSPPSERPTYIGLGGSLMAPISFVVPLVGGLLADSTGFGAVFVITTVFAVLSLLWLTFFVKEPRKARGAA